MSNTTTCPTCQRALRVPESLMGQQVKCPACGTTFLAADAEPASAPPPPPAREAERRPLREERNDRDDRRYREEREERRDRDDRGRDDRDRDDRERRPYDEDERPRERRASSDKPGKVQALGIMMLIGGILALIYGASLTLFTCGVMLVWPGTWVAVVAGILAVIRGPALLGDDAHRQSPPTVVAILQIICVLNGDLINLALGIIELVFLNDPEVKGYLRG